IISSKLFILSLYTAASSKLKSIAHLLIFSFNILISFSSFPDRNRSISSIILLYSSLVIFPVHGPTHLFICKFKQGLMLVFIAFSMSILQVLIGYMLFIISNVSLTAVVLVYGPKYFALSFKTFLTFKTLGKSSFVVTFIYGYVLSSLNKTLYLGLYLFIKLYFNINVYSYYFFIIYSYLSICLLCIQIYYYFLPYTLLYKNYSLKIENIVLLYSLVLLLFLHILYY